MDTGLKSLSDSFSKKEDVYVLCGFPFSGDSMRQMIKIGKLHERCKNLEQTLHDIESDDLALDQMI